MIFDKQSSKSRKFYFTKLERVLISKRLYLQNDFSMPDLADETGIQLYIISYVVNSELNYHFKDYINLMRIQYFKERVNDAEWKDLMVIDMLLASGFKSRTTGYRAFMKHLNMSPSDYFKLHSRYQGG